MTVEAVAVDPEIDDERFRFPGLEEVEEESEDGADQETAESPSGSGESR